MLVFHVQASKKEESFSEQLRSLTAKCKEVTSQNRYSLIKTENVTFFLFVKPYLFFDFYPR